MHADRDHRGVGRNRGTLHGFHYNFFDTAAAQKQDRDARDGLRWLLSVGQTS